jgi:membrane protein DedA with SNARE-associated domain
MAKTSEPNFSRAEKVLAFMAVGVVGLAIVCILLTLLMKAFGSNPLVIFEQIPLLALPAGALLIIALFITAATRRSRNNR